MLLTDLDTCSTFPSRDLDQLTQRCIMKHHPTCPGSYNTFWRVRELESSTRRVMFPMQFATTQLRLGWYFSVRIIAVSHQLLWFCWVLLHITFTNNTLSGMPLSDCVTTSSNYTTVSQSLRSEILKAFFFLFTKLQNIVISFLIRAQMFKRYISLSVAKDNPHRIM